MSVLQVTVDGVTQHDGSSGGTWRDGVQVTEVPIGDGVELTLGGPSGPAVSLTASAAGAPPLPQGTPSTTC